MSSHSEACIVQMHRVKGNKIEADGSLVVNATEQGLRWAIVHGGCMRVPVGLIP
jgi:hypothetical protein